MMPLVHCRTCIEEADRLTMEKFHLRQPNMGPFPWTDVYNSIHDELMQSCIHEDRWVMGIPEAILKKIVEEHGVISSAELERLANKMIEEQKQRSDNGDS